MQTRQIDVLGQPARVYEGGARGTAPLLLVHGGYGGATMHWSRVWDRLAEAHHVIAPDLPGLGNIEQSARGSVAEYAEWLIALLDAIGAETAICVGNSFGAAVTSSLAGHRPDRCRGLVLVNGIPMPATPKLLHRLGTTPPGAALMRAMLRRLAFNPGALTRAFVDERNAPLDLRETLISAGSPLISRLATLAIAGDGAPSPRAATLLIWGESDQLLGTGVKDARKLHASLPGSTLHLIPNAGHFPQLEAPDHFVEKLEAFIRTSAKVQL